MGVKIPKTLKNFNGFAGGQSYAGLVSAIQLPSVSVSTDDHKAGGMEFNRKIDMGLEDMESTFTVNQMDATLLKQVGVHNGSSTEWKFYGALNDDETTDAVQCVATMIGKVLKVEHNEAKSGEKTEDKFTMSLKYYELQVDGEVIYKIDNDNLVRIIGGVDQMASIRGAINL